MRVRRQSTVSRPSAVVAPPGRTPDDAEVQEAAALQTLDAEPQRTGRRQQQRVPAPPAEMDARLRKAVALLSTGMTRSRVVKALMADTGCDHGAAVWLVGRVWDSWTEDFEAELPKLRVAQLERIRRDLVRMRAMTRPPWPSIARHEDLFASITGTKAPVRVQVDAASEVRQSMLVIVSEMSAQEQEALIAEQLELERRAGARVIDVPGVAVEGSAA